MPDGEALLRKHNPVLVLFPQDPARPRPGPTRKHPTQGWGDYHPCNAEFAIERSHQSVSDRSWAWTWPFDRLRDRPWKALPRTGCDGLRAKLAAAAPDESCDWELDVAEVPSQTPEKAWKVYGELIDEKWPHPYQCTVYGRYGLFEDASWLQYWYLYLYNDFHNQHEMDWEVVTIALDPAEHPTAVGVSCHYGGYRRTWRHVAKEGSSPLIYVSRGSHGGYFAYDPKGFGVDRLRFRANLPLIGGAANALIQPLYNRYLRARSVHDYTAADEFLDLFAPLRDLGVRVRPELTILAQAADPDGPSFWQAYRGKWGSMRPRIVGFVGIDSPWDGETEPARRGGATEPERWGDPLRWLVGLGDDDPRPER